MRRSVLWLLGAAILLPILSLCLVWLEIDMNRQRGLSFEGKGAIGGLLFAGGLSALLWVMALFLYVVSWFRDAGASWFRRIIETALFCAWLCGFCVVYRYVLLH